LTGVTTEVNPDLTPDVEGQTSTKSFLYRVLSQHPGLESGFDAAGLAATLEDMRSTGWRIMWLLDANDRCGQDVVHIIGGVGDVFSGGLVVVFLRLDSSASLEGTSWDFEGECHDQGDAKWIVVRGAVKGS
jgi:hypothetical protein